MFSQFRLCPREASAWESVYGVLYGAPFSLEGPSGETQWQGQPGEAPESQEPSKPGCSKEANQDSPRARSELFLLRAAPSRSILLLVVMALTVLPALTPYCGHWAFPWTLPFNPLNPEGTKANFVSIFINKETEEI